MLTERNNLIQSCRTATLQLLKYCQSRDWAGVDPYDAVNSGIFKAVPILDSRIPRLILTQALKRSPINVRSLLFVRPTQNPKALGLFLASLLKLSKLGLLEREDLIQAMTDKIVSFRSTGYEDWCWGYSFSWQTRTLLVPRGTPNVVCTSFVADALMDAYEQTGKSSYLEMAISSVEYILKHLYWTDGNSVAGLAYPLPSIRTNVHNANLLGAALFCRVAKHSGEKRFIEPALRVARFSASRQRVDGSWTYGEHPSQSWVDNFHTGYNLGALQSIDRSLGTSEFESNIQRGFEFYKNHFFLEDGTCKYFHNSTYPIDIHCVAQSIITLASFSQLDSNSIALAGKVFNWAMNHMWNDKGYFYYRVLRSCTIRTSYMRWSQAWMLTALSTLLCELEASTKHQQSQHPPYVTA